MAGLRARGALAGASRADLPGRGDERDTGSAAGRRMVADPDRDRGPDAARSGDSDYGRRHRPGLLASRVRRKPRSVGAQRAGTGGHRRRARDDGRLGDRRPVERRRVVGIYPRANIRSWDIAKGAGRELDSTEIAGGVLAAARAGRGVINLSVGGTRDLAVEIAVAEAIAGGSLIVASSGNDGDRGSAVGYPAAFPYVTTVAATDRSGSVASFSSRSPYVDIAAPGADIVVASRSGRTGSAAPGRAFRRLSSPEQPRGSGRFAPAHCRAGRDPPQVCARHRSGRAIRHPASACSTSAARSASRRRSRSLRAERRRRGSRPERQQVPRTGAAAHDADAAHRTGRGHGGRREDPRDVFRVWLPARTQVTATLTGSARRPSLHSPQRSGQRRFATTGRPRRPRRAARPSACVSATPLAAAGPTSW